VGLTLGRPAPESPAPEVVPWTIPTATALGRA
jgi:hypothetical protein